jgi:hypothetical protein
VLFACKAPRENEREEKKTARAAPNRKAPNPVLRAKRHKQRSANAEVQPQKEKKKRRGKAKGSFAFSKGPLEKKA